MSSIAMNVESLQAPASIGFRRTNKSMPVCQSASRAMPASIPERDLWMRVLLNTYQEIAHAGEGSKAHREALEDIADLREITAHLGYPENYADRLIEMAVTANRERKMARQAAAK